MKKLFMHIKGDARLVEAVKVYAFSWPLLKDYSAEIVNAEQFAKLIPDAPSYWCVKGNDYGIVIDEGAEKYTKTCEDLKRGISDFCSGWHAAIRKT